uniref:Cilia and flagella associated protein 99 n=1 Tax=Cyprinodon variegatus TaxID=28743 RepID=A0A3Q2DVA1_CYPVA
GCVEYKKLLDVVISAFYVGNKKWLRRSDRSQFIVICYLTIFSLDELGLKNFSSIVKSLGTQKMHLFLHFFLSNLTHLIQEELNSIYEAEFVQKNLVGPLLRWRPEINLLLDQLDAAKELEVRKAAVKTTQCEEFNLTKPRPHLPPIPEPISVQEKSKPVPNSTYTAPKEMQIIEEIKEKNQQKAEVQRLLLPSSSQNRFWLLIITCNLENSKIERLVEGGRDPLSILQREREILKREHKEQVQRTELKRLETQICKKEVALARTRITEQNLKAAQLKKEELMKRYAEKRLQEEEQFRELAKQVAEGEKNAKAAKEKITKLKQKIVKEVSEQNQELLRQALEEQQKELCRKFQIIHEIHVIETLPRIRLNGFDDTEVSRFHTQLHGSLGMSLAELKVRLALLRQRQQKEEEERRSLIVAERQKKKQEMQEALEKIELHRRVLAKEEKKAKQKLLQQFVAQDETILALKKKLEEKTQECQRVKQTEMSRTKPAKKTSTGPPAQVSLPQEFILLVFEFLHLQLIILFIFFSQKDVKTWEELEQSLARYIQDTP